MASKKTPPAVLLNLSAQQPPLVVVMNTVIVFQGPGTWKREAYWDEYVVSIAKQGQVALAVNNAILAGTVIAPQAPGADPWEIEEQSHKILNDKNLGRQIVAGVGSAAGIYALEYGTVALAATAITTSSAAVVAGATVALVALPGFVVGSGIRGITAPHGIKKEFNRRRLALPLELQPGEARQGSLFFPITPASQHLELDFSSDGATQSANIDLASISSLHFLGDPTGTTAPKVTPR